MLETAKLSQRKVKKLFPLYRFKVAMPLSRVEIFWITRTL